MSCKTLLVCVAVFISQVSGSWAGRNTFDILGVNYGATSTAGLPSGATNPEIAMANSLGRDFASVAREARAHPESGWLDVFVTGDGYTAQEMPRFKQLSVQTAQAVYNDQVIKESGADNRIRFVPYFFPSNNRGASSAGRRRFADTAFGATFRDSSRADTTVSVNFDKVWGMARQVQNANIRYCLVLVNHKQYVASSWSNGIAVISDFGETPTFNAGDIANHELVGHTFCGLWDEYEYKGTHDVLPGIGPNCAETPYPHKWADMMGKWWNYLLFTNVASYRGCASSIYYRPTYQDCRMNSWASRPFCPVCRRQIIARLGGR
jgi:hypothetical protein